MSNVGSHVYADSADAAKFESCGSQRCVERRKDDHRAAAARVGVNVIVDEVVIDKTSWDDWVVALAGLEVVWVGIRCSAEVAEDRNRVRGDRFLGLARAQTATAHLHTRYDFEIDTTTRTPGEAILELTRRLGI